jgi:hypothetical protein
MSAHVADGVVSHLKLHNFKFRMGSNETDCLGNRVEANDMGPFQLPAIPWPAFDGKRRIFFPNSRCLNSPREFKLRTWVTTRGP